MTTSPLQLTNADYKKVLKYYNQQVPRSYRKTKKNAESLLTNKLCKCIQKVKKTMKQRNKSLKNTDALQRSVGICRDSVLHKKNIDVYQFQCDKTQKLGNYPNKRFSLSKYRKSKTNTRKISKNINTSEKESEVKV